MSLHLHPVETTATAPEAGARPNAVYLVVQRANGHWSAGAKIITVHDIEADAEAAAQRLRTRYPEQAFGVFKLRSEARPVAVPVEIVRVESDDA